jgi:beta-lactamase class A
MSLTLRDVCTLMTVVSDNTATNMIIEHLGIETINHRMRSLGLPRTTLNRKSFSPDTSSLLSTKYGLGVTTPNEMLSLLTRLAEGKIGDAETSADILSLLEKQQYRDGIPRCLPADWKYAGKTGSVNPVRNDVGIVTAPDGRRFALSLFVQKLPLVFWTPDNPGLLAVARLARLLVGLGEK